MGKVGNNPESAPIRLLPFRNRLRKVGPPRIIRSRSESSGAVWSCSESSRVVQSWSRLESSGVVRNYPESSRVGVVLVGVAIVRSLLESSGIMQSLPELALSGSSGSMSFGVVWSRAESSRVFQSRSRSHPVSSGLVLMDSGRLQTNSADLRRLQTNPNDTGPDDYDSG